MRPDNELLDAFDASGENRPSEIVQKNVNKSEIDFLKTWHSTMVYDHSDRVMTSRLNAARLEKYYFRGKEKNENEGM